MCKCGKNGKFSLKLYGFLQIYALLLLLFQNELAILEFIHCLVETMDRYFGNVVSISSSFILDCNLCPISMDTLYSNCVDHEDN